CMETYTSAFERKEAFAIEFRVRRSDGEFRWIQGCGVPNISPAGEFVGYTGSAIDITDYKVAQGTLARLLEEVNQLKCQLEAANVYLLEEIKLENKYNEMEGSCDGMKRFIFIIEQESPTDIT